MGNATEQIRGEIRDRRVLHLERRLNGLIRYLSGEPYNVSTGIDGSTTYGYGDLSELGYWEYPIPEKLAHSKKGGGTNGG